MSESRVEGRERRTISKIALEWIRSTQQGNEINQQAVGAPEGMKLKALHHSILVKAEFFMKQIVFLCRTNRKGKKSERKSFFSFFLAHKLKYEFFVLSSSPLFSSFSVIYVLSFAKKNQSKRRKKSERKSSKAINTEPRKISNIQNDSYW